jgi:hypothetical protein
LFALAAALPLSLLGAQRADDFGGELVRLRLQVGSLELMLRQREARIETLASDLAAMKDELLSLRERLTNPVAGPFLSGPPPSSDSAGVAPVAVFAPGVAVVQTARRHDTVFLKLRRIEAGALRVLGEAQLESGEDRVDLPIDQSGALYVVDWSTSEGHEYDLVLRDGATGLTAATVHVKQLQNQGRFLFVGYRLD